MQDIYLVILSIISLIIAIIGLGISIKIYKEYEKNMNKLGEGKDFAKMIESYVSPDGTIENCEHDAIGNMAVAFVGTSGVQMGWLASQADMLADDWIFAE